MHFGTEKRWNLIILIHIISIFYYSIFFPEQNNIKMKSIMLVRTRVITDYINNSYKFVGITKIVLCI